MKTEQNFLLLCDVLSPYTGAEAITQKWHFASFGQQDWQAIVQVASRHYVTPSLYTLCKTKGLLPQLPGELQDYLEGIYQLNLERNLGLKAQALETIALLNQIGIEPILLKGIASLMDDLYPDLGMRVLGDIDILVPPERLDEAVALLLNNRYTFVDAPSQWSKGVHLHHHAPGLVKDGWPGKIELHRRLTCFTSVRHGLLNNREHWQSSQPMAMGDNRFLVLAPEIRLLHNFYHSQINDKNFFYGRIQLRQMMEWVWLRVKFGDMIAWNHILEDINRHQFALPLTAYLLNAQFYFGQTLPATASSTRMASLQVKREQLFRDFPLIRRSVCWPLCICGVIYSLFCLKFMRLKYGDVSLPQAYWLRLVDFCNPRWLRGRWLLIKQLLAGY
ncbi:nucleotidyltransferase family protein [Crenothrix polyspora]|uniref:Nucleotidyltransferase family protein n=1 Tax=Crenothrix polyspora TaxID=360316 RepID=A0A1R4H2K1_9GAMM|nr:nucleotidyltransferase family protein [Crenothrix polyspora]SJM90415.1 hypothetical protein CRENPOLYSF1_1430003 [Crenothrix polyspora]